MSNPKWFKYCWTWNKVTGKGHLVAKKRPLQQTEDIAVFGKGAVNYHPIKEPMSKPRKIKEYTRTVIMGGRCNADYERTTDFRYPKTLLTFSWSPATSLHPTQKPVALIEYLIKTYTKEGELILDNTAGSGTLAIACINTDRRYICIEKDEHYFEVMRTRIANHDPHAPVKPKRTSKPKPITDGQLNLFRL
jgi:site-specific DNA-methyltransferase (adenine-specific)